jgi:hypothetical protein
LGSTDIFRGRGCLLVFLFGVSGQNKKMKVLRRMRDIVYSAAMDQFSTLL